MRKLLFMSQQLTYLTGGATLAYGFRPTVGIGSRRRLPV